MNELELGNFKAFRETISMKSPNNNNLLIYGENGAGKSSIFEGFKLFYFKERLFRELITPNIVGQERTICQQQILDDYRKCEDSAIIVKVDGEDFKVHDSSNDSVFLFSYKNLNDIDTICIEDIINKAYFSGINQFKHWLSQDLCDLIVEMVNLALHDFFWLDDVVLQCIDAKGNCSLKNKDNQIPKRVNLSQYFNEAILHVVVFSIIIQCVAYFYKKSEHLLIVMDDCFNSLDVPNRTFMVRYLLKETKDIQKIILTHNTGFFNLFYYIVNNVEKENEKWSKLQLCVINEKHRFLDGTEKTTQDLMNEADNINANVLGNDLRQRFEILIYQLTRVSNLGEIQEIRDLLDKLCSKNSHIHLSIDSTGKLKDIYTLVDEIYANVTNGNTTNLHKRLKEKIENFRNHDFLNSLKPILIELRLMQKVTLHQTSHGHLVLPPISEKEIKVVSALLKRLESAILLATKQVDVSSV